MEWTAKPGSFNLILFYRFEDHVFADGVSIHLSIYVFEKETPQGWWITPHPTWIWDVDINKRWVSKFSLKKFAYPSREEALKNFVARKGRQVAILKDRLSNAQHALELGKMMLDGKESMLKHRLYGGV